MSGIKMRKRGSIYPRLRCVPCEVKEVSEGSAIAIIAQEKTERELTN